MKTNTHLHESAPGKDLAVIEPPRPENEVFTDVEVLEVGDYKDAHRIDHEYVKHIRDKVAEMVLESNPSVTDGEGGTKRVELSEQAEKEFEGMFLNELMQRLADGSLSERELSEASVVPDVFANGWQKDGVSYEISSDNLATAAGLAGNLVKAIAVLDHVIPPEEDGSTDDNKDHISGHKRTSATARSAASYIDSADHYLEKLDPDQTNTEVRELVDKVSKKALEKWPKEKGHPVGVMPMRWL